MLFVPTAFDSAGLEVLVPKEGKFLPEDAARILLNYKLQLPSGYFEFLGSKDQQTKRKIAIDRYKLDDSTECLGTALLYW